MHYIPLSSEALFFWNSAYNYKPWLTSLLLLVTNYWNIVFYGILTKIFFRVESKYPCFKRKIILRTIIFFPFFFYYYWMVLMLDLDHLHVLKHGCTHSVTKNWGYSLLESLQKTKSLPETKQQRAKINLLLSLINKCYSCKWI